MDSGRTPLLSADADDGDDDGVRRSDKEAGHESAHVSTSRKTLIGGLVVGLLALIAAIAITLAVVLGTPVTVDYSSLAGYCDDVKPIDEQLFAERRALLAARMTTAGIAAFVTEPGAAMTYLSDVQWKLSERSFLLVVQANGEFFFICPAFEEGTAREQTGPDAEMILWEENESPFTKVWERLNIAEPGATVAVDSETRFFIPDGLRVTGPTYTVTNGFELMRGLRAIKTASEIAILRCANELTKAAIKLVATSFMREGVTEDATKDELYRALETGGLTDTWALVLFDQNAAYPHGTENRITLASNHMVLIDTGGDLYGYQADISRTFTYPIGSYTEEQNAWWTTVQQAQLAALQAIAPSRPAGDIDAAARSVVCAASPAYCSATQYDTFTHRLGHGIGLQGHEEVYMVQGNTYPLEPGLCFSVEPGIYIIGRGGVRIEDIVCTTAEAPYYEVFGALTASLADPFNGH